MTQRKQSGTCLKRSGTSQSRMTPSDSKMLQGHNSEFSAARTLVDCYRPAQAEIMSSLQKGQGLYVHARTILAASVSAPTFDSSERHAAFLRYLCEVRDENCTCFEWLHKHNIKFDPVRLLARNKGSCNAVCLRFDRKLSLKFWGQVLLCHCPCWRLQELMHPSADRVPQRYRNMIALFFYDHLQYKCRVDVTNETSVQQFLQKECLSKQRRNEMVAILFSTKVLFERFLDNTLYASEESQ